MARFKGSSAARQRGSWSGQARCAAQGPGLGQNGILLALAATAYHAIAGEGARSPELIVGHGIVGHLLARITVALGSPRPTVWENNAHRRGGADGYAVVDPPDDARRDYGAIYDASGAPPARQLIRRLAKNGEITLAGFYEAPLSFAFPPAFMREARIRVAAEWARPDIVAVDRLDRIRPPQPRWPDQQPRRHRTTRPKPTAPPSATHA